MRDHSIIVWSDKDLKKGEEWYTQIQEQLARTRVGILLVSADFIASDFIYREEVPALLRAADQDGATILPIIVRPCSFTDTKLGRIQAMNDPGHALSMLTVPQREQLMVQVYNKLRRIFEQAPPPPTSPTIVSLPTNAASVEHLPEAYAKLFQQYGEERNNVFIPILFHKLNQDGILVRFEEHLLDKKYSARIGSAVPVLARERVKMPNQFRHYSDHQLTINAAQYYLSSEWNKPQRHLLLKWLIGDVFPVQ